MGLPVQERAFAGKDPVLMPVMDKPSHLGTFITVMSNACCLFNTNLLSSSVATEYCYLFVC